MIARRLVIVGAGGFGREAADVVMAMNDAAAEPQWNLLGVYDDAPTHLNIERLQDRGIKTLGPIPTSWDGPDVDFVVGIGDPLVRKNITKRLEPLGWTAATLVHPSAVIGTQSFLQPGTVVCGGVQVSTNVQCGKHVHLNPNVTIGHDTILSDFVSINPASTVSGGVKVGECSLIGAASVILQGLTVNDRSIVGAAACVVRDVPPTATVKGVPAK